MGVVVPSGGGEAGGSGVAGDHRLHLSPEIVVGVVHGVDGLAALRLEQSVGEVGVAGGGSAGMSDGGAVSGVVVGVGIEDGARVVWIRSGLAQHLVTVGIRIGDGLELVVGVGADAVVAVVGVGAAGNHSTATGLSNVSVTKFLVTKFLHNFSASASLQTLPPFPVLSDVVS